MSRKGPVSRFIIYGLTEADSGTIRYVGMSSSGLRRPRQHVAPSIAGKGMSPKSIWVRSLLANGKKPGVCVLQECDTEIALGSAEALWIESLKAVGAPLLNVVDGGRYRGHGPTLASTREKVRAQLVGRSKSEEHKRKIREARRDFVMPESGKAKISAALKGRVFSEEHRARIAAGVRAARARAKEVCNAPE